MCELVVCLNHILIFRYFLRDVMICYQRDVTTISVWPSLDQRLIPRQILQALAVLDMEDASSSLSQRSPLQPPCYQNLAM